MLALSSGGGSFFGGYFNPTEQIKKKTLLAVANT
jgi:hypothetical protein